MKNGIKKVEDKVVEIEEKTLYIQLNEDDYKEYLEEISEVSGNTYWLGIPSVEQNTQSGHRCTISKSESVKLGEIVIGWVR